jgi:hypothetical protein
MKAFLKEPLVHFLLLGAALFVAFEWMPGERASVPERIVVTQGRIESLATGFTRTWQRPPTESELQGLIREYIREEVCTREAVAMGLDREDSVIRRRLRQKLEFITEDLTAQGEPTDEDLRAYMEASAASFQMEQRFTFRHVYLSPERRGEHLSRDVAYLIEQLSQSGRQDDASAFGDPFLLGHEFDAAPSSEVTKLFGKKFTSVLGGLPAGQWQGPVESGYGVHLVYVAERTEQRTPTLEEVRDVVLREWANAKRREATEKFYETLLKRYTVTIEQPEPTEDISAKRLAEAK